MFTNTQQLEVLSRAKKWYVDGTFKLCRAPLKQLLTVNGFVRSGDCKKQVPLLFVIVSDRKKKDYRAVFRALIDILRVPPAASRITVDVDRAVWSVRMLRQVFPVVKIQGCVFHCTQALWRKVCNIILMSVQSSQAWHFNKILEPVLRSVTCIASISNFFGVNYFLDD